MWGQIFVAMSQLLLVLVLFARTLSLSRSFCSVSRIAVKILVVKVTPKLQCSAWATLTVSAYLLTKIVLILHCSLSRKARTFQGRRTSTQGCAKKTHACCLCTKGAVYVLRAVLHFAFDLKAETTNWHSRKGGRWGYQTSQATLSPLGECWLVSSPPICGGDYCCRCMVTADPVQGWQDILSDGKLYTIMAASVWVLNTWAGDVYT